VTPQLLEMYPKQKIYTVDSLCASIGEGLLVMQAAMQKEKGLDIEALRDWVEAHKMQPRHWFTVKDLFYLKRGGRVSAIEAVVGTALKIRPVLSTDDYGKLAVITKIRGSKAELDFLLSKMEQEGIDLSQQTVMIGHGDDFEKAKELETLIRSKSLVKDIVIAKIGPIIGTHTGPGMLALTYMGKREND
jgi:DegV family protein with EDD domain